jgi:hypothetical protein
VRIRTGAWSHRTCSGIFFGAVSIGSRCAVSARCDKNHFPGCATSILGNSNQCICFSITPATKEYTGREFQVPYENGLVETGAFPPGILGGRNLSAPGTDSCRDRGHGTAHLHVDNRTSLEFDEIGPFYFGGVTRWLAGEMVRVAYEIRNETPKVRRSSWEKNKTSDPVWVDHGNGSVIPPGTHAGVLIRPARPSLRDLMEVRQHESDN